MGRSSNDDRSDRFNPNNDTYAAAEANEASQRGDDWDDDDVDWGGQPQSTPQPRGQSVAVATEHMNYKLSGPLVLDRLSHIFVLGRAVLSAQDHQVANPKDLRARDAKVRELAVVAQDPVTAIGKKRYEPSGKWNCKRTRAGEGEWFLTHDSLCNDHAYYAMKSESMSCDGGDSYDFMGGRHPGPTKRELLEREREQKKEMLRRKQKVMEERDQYQKFLHDIVSAEQGFRKQGLLSRRGNVGAMGCGVGDGVFRLDDKLAPVDHLPSIDVVDADGPELCESMIAGLRSLVEAAQAGTTLKKTHLIVPSAGAPAGRFNNEDRDWIQTIVPPVVLQPEGSSVRDVEGHAAKNTPGWTYHSIGPVRAKFSDAGWGQVNIALSAVEYLVAPYPTAWNTDGLMAALQHVFSSVEWSGAKFSVLGLRQTMNSPTPLELRWFSASCEKEAAWLIGSLLRDCYRAIALPVIPTQQLKLSIGQEQGPRGY